MTVDIAPPHVLNSVMCYIINTGAYNIFVVYFMQKYEKLYTCSYAFLSIVVQTVANFVQTLSCYGLLRMPVPASGKRP